MSGSRIPSELKILATVVLSAACLALWANAGPMGDAAAQTVKCKYMGQPYAPGTRMKISGKMQVCRDTGVWQHLGYGGSASGISCYVGDRVLRPGQAMCDGNVQIRCGSNGEWGPTGQSC